MRKLRIIGCSIAFLLFSLTFAFGEEVEIRILHINDFHGFAEPYKPFGSEEALGGITCLATKANKLRLEKPSLLLSAGDMIQGNNWANLFQGQSVIELMNRMAFDAMVVGNHEFDFGQEVLKKRISEARFPILGANVEGLENLTPYIIKDIKGIKIAVIGVETEDAPVSTHPRNVQGLKFLSPAETVEHYVKQLNAKADLIIVLSHIGFPTDIQLAGKVKGVDIIVGGHTHTKVMKPVSIGETIIVQAWEHAKALGVLDLSIRDGKIVRSEGYLEEINPKTCEEDPTVLAIVKKYSQRVDALLDEIVGESEVDLDGENVRRKETNLGDLIADVMRDTSGADITITNGGGIRTSIKKGKVRIKDVYAALPFDSYIIAIKLKGKEIWEALEHGVSAVKDGGGRFPQVSGLSFKYVASGKKGARIKEILIAGRPIDSEREYVVATNDFLAAGGDGYKVFEEAARSSRNFSITGGMIKGEKIVYSNSGQWLRDLIAAYIKKMKRVNPGVEGRIVEID